MKTIQKDRFEELCKLMPDSYRQSLLSISTLNIDGVYEIEDAAFFELHKSVSLPRIPLPIPANPPSPSLLTKAGSLANSVGSWAKAGFQVVDESQLQSRLDICKGCEFWDQSGYAGTGKCKECGCSTQGKLRMATSYCPLNPPKWGPVAQDQKQDQV
jgi:hypothetical protein